MRSLLAVTTLLLAAGPVLSEPLSTTTGRASPPPNVSATGKTMPPANGVRDGAPLKTSVEAEMLKSQKATEARNKAWDTKTRKTMSTICNGC